MLSVPSVAMIEGRPSTRISVAFRTPVARPMPTSASAPSEQQVPGFSLLHRERGGNDAQRHERCHRHVEATDEQGIGLADRDEGERHGGQQQVVEVVLGEEGILR